MAMTNGSSYLSRILAIQKKLDAHPETIRQTFADSEFGFSEVSDNGFNKTNVLKDLAENVSEMAVCEESTMPTIGSAKGYNIVNSMPLRGYGKNDVKYSYPSYPQAILTEHNSNTLATDRADGQLDISRWTTRNIFKFDQNHYGYDRCVFRIPVTDLANGVVIATEDGSTPHENTLANYPYPEEIIMTSQKTEKNFIHFINVQYTDAHYGNYNGRHYNLMIARDRTRYGVENASGDGFAEYTSLYVNNVNTELAFYEDGWLYLPVPSEYYGEEMLDTLWDCRVIWRSDAPDREISVSLSLETDNAFAYMGSFYDLDVSNDRPILTNSSAANSYFTAQRGSMYVLDGSISTRISCSEPCVIGTNGKIYIAPNFSTTYSPLSEDEVSWQADGTPNQFFKISDDRYIGFYYRNRAEVSSGYNSQYFNNHTDVLYWNVFDSRMHLIYYETFEPGQAYPCSMQSFSATTVRIFKGDISPADRSASFYVFTQEGAYLLTLTDLGDDTYADYVEELVTYPSYSPYTVMRIGKYEYWVYTTDGVVLFVDLAARESDIAYFDSINVLLGRTRAAHISEFDTMLYSIGYPDYPLEVNDGFHDVTLMSTYGIAGQYGFFENSDGQIMCKLVENYTFSKELT